MSVAFNNNSCSDSNWIQPQGLCHGMWIYNISESTRFIGGNPWTSRLPAVKEEEDSTSSSSIGKNSDTDGGDSDEEDDEVQSKDNGPLNKLNALEEILPIKRGISSFYAGKSKSYGSLADASFVPSIQDIVKPEDAYSRKRKNMLAHSVLFDKHCKSTSESRISKRFTNFSRSGNHDIAGNGENPNPNSSLPNRSLPPLPRNSGRPSAIESTNCSSSSPGLYFSPWRSLSLSDLQHASSIVSSVINKRGKEDEH
ncbi:hypothetical protein L2E82_12821 [Cichorium intybus]|uniref:Uncharacterized protein n=1 Tax=Cichorium intybus TaxID=13427 RepID=A0ACB9GHS4_CICIN|nr:hypothetical protein L2E82_12821 [Cichorium intybus]